MDVNLTNELVRCTERLSDASHLQTQLPSTQYIFQTIRTSTAAAQHSRMFDPVSRHEHIVKQGDAARQAELLLRDKRILSLTVEEWRNYLLLFPDDVLDQVDRLQKAGQGEGAAKFYLQHACVPLGRPMPVIQGCSLWKYEVGAVSPAIFYRSDCLHGCYYLVGLRKVCGLLVCPVGFRTALKFAV